MNRVTEVLLRLGERRPYFHIYSLSAGAAQGDLYMGRWWLLGGSNPDNDSDETRPDGAPRTWERGAVDSAVGRVVSARLHHIARADRERDHHDHPRSFLSVVVGGWYLEALPEDQGQHPSEDPRRVRHVLRKAGSVAFRRAGDRHTIARVSPGGAWTVFVLLGGRSNRWGFYPPLGKVSARRYFRGERVPISGEFD